MDSTSESPPDDLRRVLVVDDDHEYLQGFIGKLKKFNYEVTARSSSREAMDLLEETKGGLFDFVIIAVNEPNLDGLKLIEYASLVRHHLPLIVMCQDFEMASKYIHLDASPFVKSSLGENMINFIWYYAYGEFLDKKKKAAAERETIDKFGPVMLSGPVDESAGPVSRLRSGRAWRKEDN